MTTQRSPVAPAIDRIIQVAAFIPVPPARAFGYFIPAGAAARNRKKHVPRKSAPGRERARNLSVPRSSNPVDDNSP